MSMCIYVYEIKPQGKNISQLLKKFAFRLPF